MWLQKKLFRFFSVFLGEVLFPTHQPRLLGPADSAAWELCGSQTVLLSESLPYFYLKKFFKNNPFCYYSGAHDGLEIKTSDSTCHVSIAVPFVFNNLIQIFPENIPCCTSLRPCTCPSILHQIRNTAQKSFTNPLSHQLFLPDRLREEMK